MFRQDAFNVKVYAPDPFTPIEGVFYDIENTYVTYEAEIHGSFAHDAHTETAVESVDFILLNEDDEDITATLTEEQLNDCRDDLITRTEESSHEEAWEARYDDR